MNDNEKFDIQIDVRTIEIPISEYKRLVTMELKCDLITDMVKTSYYASDTARLVKALFPEKFESEDDA